MSKRGEKRILVPVDFTPCSDAALDYALALADESGAEVDVVHVWRPSESVAFADTPGGVAMEKLLRAAESLHDRARVCARLELGEEPWSAILRVVEVERFDMIVMGKLGRLAERLAQLARCKVVTLARAG